MSSKAQAREKDYERGLRIADRRKAIGLSQDELAHRVGIGRQALSAIENGGDFKVSVLRKIAVVLNCSTDELLYGVFSSINEEMQDNIMNELKRMSEDEIKNGCICSGQLTIFHRMLRLLTKKYTDIIK